MHFVGWLVSCLVSYVMELAIFSKLQKYFHCHTVRVVELLSHYTNHCTFIKFIKFYTLKH
jgi:hypothetical protein